MKRPYKLAVLATSGITIFALIQCLFNSPEWIGTTIVGMLEVIFALYLASKDEPLTGIEDLDEKILFVLFCLSLVLTYPKIIYEMWNDREEIKKRIRK